MPGKSIRRRILVAAAVAAAVMVPAGPAMANVGMSQSLSMDSGAAVGQVVDGSFTVRNTNTAPNQAETNIVTLRMAPSCGSAATTDNLCPSPDLGVFSVDSPANGAAGTACAGVTFTVSAPDAAGVVTFSAPSPPTLAPPGGAPGSDRCTVDSPSGP